MTGLAGEVQQWRDGRWRTVLTASGNPVVDNREAHIGFGDYVNGPPTGQETLLGFDGSSSDTATFAYMRDGRVHVVDIRGERPR